MSGHRNKKPIAQQPRKAEEQQVKSRSTTTILLPDTSKLSNNEVQTFFETNYPDFFDVKFKTAKDKNEPNIVKYFAFITFTNEETVATLVRQKSIRIGNKNVPCKNAFDNKAGDLAKTFITNNYLQSKKDTTVEQVMKFDVKRADNKPMDTLVGLEETVNYDVVITNEAKKGHFLSAKFDQFGHNKHYKVNIKGGKVFTKNNLQEEVLLIGASKSHVVRITFSQKEIQTASYGKFKLQLGFKFLGTIGAPVSIVTIVGDEEAMNLLKPTSEYIETKEEDMDIVRRIIPAYPPERKSKSHLHTDVETYWQESLPIYEIPSGLQLDIDANDKYTNLNPWNLVSSYREKMHSLLWMEEATQKKIVKTI